MVSNIILEECQMLRPDPIHTRELTLIVIVGLGVILTFFLVEPISQDAVYHHFADNRIFFGIPNTLDVLSNIPFMIIGAWGILFTGKLLKKKLSNAPALHYLVFFSGIMLTGLGSAYYHYAPSNETLFWDRLAITIAFTGFFCSVLSEMISSRASLVLISPLLFAAMGSVGYWIWSETLGRGDLRLYGLVQFLPMILIPLILIMYKRPENYLGYIVATMIFYGISKITELHDVQIFQLFGVISGHTLKHLLAAAGTCCIIIMLHNRRYQSVTRQI